MSVGPDAKLTLPPPCPVCGGQRRWDFSTGGGLDAVCDDCPRRGAFDDLKAAVDEVLNSGGRVVPRD